MTIYLDLSPNLGSLPIHHPPLLSAQDPRALSCSYKAIVCPRSQPTRSRGWSSGALVPHGCCSDCFHPLLMQMSHLPLLEGSWIPQGTEPPRERAQIWQGRKGHRRNPPDCSEKAWLVENLPGCGQRCRVSPLPTLHPWRTNDKVLASWKSCFYFLDRKAEAQEGQDVPRFTWDILS